MLFLLRRWVISLTSHLYDWTTVEGTEPLARLSSLRWVARRKLMVLPIGYPQDYCPIAPYENGARENLILCTSRIAQQKGLADLLTAFARADASVPGWRLTLVGPVTEPNYAEHLRELVTRLSLETKVRFAGFVSDAELTELYRQASIFCLPSVVENAGQVRYEAMASGLPLITTAAGTGRDFESAGARVIPVGDVLALEAALRELMSDPALRARVAAAQQRHLQSYLDVAREFVAAVDRGRRADVAPAARTGT